MTNTGFAYGKEFYDMWEKMMGEWFENVMKSPGFMSNMGKTLENSLDWKASIDRYIEQNLETMHLPSKKDIEKILSLLHLLEERMLDLEEQVQSVAQRLDQNGGRTETKEHLKQRSAR